MSFLSLSGKGIQSSSIVIKHFGLLRNMCIPSLFLLRKLLTISFLFFFILVEAQHTEEHHHTGGNSEGDVRSVLIKFRPKEKPVSRIVEVIDGYVIYEGDIILGTEEDIFKNKSAVILDFGSNRWDNSIIPYEIGSGYAPEDIRMIEYSINHVIEHTNICMVERTTETQWVKFEVSSGCSSFIGRVSEQNPPVAQTINLSPFCGVASTVHEILHAAGYFHEQSRIDRDTYVDINIGNVEEGKEHNFDQINSSFGQDLGAYDYGSIMHYSPFAFTANGGPTIEVKMPPGTASTNVGQRVGLSAGDISGVNTIYTTAPACNLITGLPSNLTISSLGSIMIDENAQTLTVGGIEVKNVGNVSSPITSVYMSRRLQTTGSSFVFDQKTIPVLAPGATTTFYSGSTYDLSGYACDNYTFGVWIDPFNATTDGTIRDNSVRWNLPVYDQISTVSINQASGQADTTNNPTILFDVEFSESVTGFTSGDVILSGTAGPTTAVVNGSGSDYTVSVTGMTAEGTVIASIGAGAAQNQDSGCDNFASFSSDNSVYFDMSKPTVTINQAEEQADPTTMSPILFDVVFSESVTGFSTGDVTLSGTAGATTAVVSGSGTNYTITVSGMTGDGVVIASIAADQAVDIAGNGNMTSTSSDNTVTYDGTMPTVSMNQGSGQSDPTNRSSILFDVVFSESVTGFSTGDVTLSGTAGATSAVVSGSGTTYTVTVTGMTGDGTVIASIAADQAMDAAGNGNLMSTSLDNIVTYDGTMPTVTMNQGSEQSDPTNASSIVFDVVFSESVTGFSTGDVTLSGSAGATTAVVSGSGTSYTVSVSGMTGDGTVIASIAADQATDAAGNDNIASTSSDNTVIYDGTLPTVTIDQGSGQSDPTNASDIVFDVAFSESVTGFETGDVTLSGTAGATTAVVSGSGTTYTVTVSGMTGDGTVIASITVDGAMDPAGNGNTASSSSDNTVTYDGTLPTVTINQGSGQSDPTNTSSIVFDVVFSESVTGFSTGDVTLSGTAGATTAVVSGSGTNYTVTVSGMTGDGTIIASIAADEAMNAVGNGNIASTSSDNTVIYDTTGPTVTINQGSMQNDPTIFSPIIFDVVFSEEVSDFETGDVTLSGTAGATTASVTGSGANYIVSVNGMTENGSVLVLIPADKASDSLGNMNTESTSLDREVTFDAIRIPCTQDVLNATDQLMSTNSLPFDLWAITTLNSDGVIKDGENYTFQAGDVVNLDLGFEIENDGLLTVSFDDCN